MSNGVSNTAFLDLLNECSVVSGVDLFASDDLEAEDGGGRGGGQGGRGRGQRGRVLDTFLKDHVAQQTGAVRA